MVPVLKSAAKLARHHRDPHCPHARSTDQEMLTWINLTVRKATPTVRAIRSFKDPSLTTGIRAPSGDRLTRAEEGLWRAKAE
ncbi:hypothetical protein V8E55_006913 [Tylopilus felleus]